MTFTKYRFWAKLPAATFPTAAASLMGLAVMALAAIAGCSDRTGRQEVDPRIADVSRPLVFVTQPADPPFSYRNAAGEIVGSSDQRDAAFDAVLSDVRRHADGTEQADDCTQLLIRYFGEPGAASHESAHGKEDRTA